MSSSSSPSGSIDRLPPTSQAATADTSPALAAVAAAKAVDSDDAAAAAAAAASDSETARCLSGHPNLRRDSSWDNLERPRTCKLSATLKKRSHNHYIPSCMGLGKIEVTVKKVSLNLQEIADLVAACRAADTAIDTAGSSSSSSGSGTAGQQQLDAKEMASLTTLLKEVRVDMEVRSHDSAWSLVRHLHQLVEFDDWLHKCCLQRCAKYNNLFDLRQTFAQSYRSFSPSNETAKSQMLIILQYYFRCFSSLSGQPDFSNRLVCPLALDILDLDCKGQRLSLTDRYNTQGIELAVVVRDFQPACEDELPLSRGDYVAVTYVSVNMDSPTWWEGKVVPQKDLQQQQASDATVAAAGLSSSRREEDSVEATSGNHQEQQQQQRPRRIGFFPSNCVRIVGPGQTPASVAADGDSDGGVGGEGQQQYQHQPHPHQQHQYPPLPQSKQQQQQQPQSIRSKYPRLLDSLRAFFRSRPDPNELRRTGILRNGLFGSDLASYLGEHNLDYPAVLTFCVNLIQSHGDGMEGLYRKSGSGSEIQRLVRLFEFGGTPNDACTCVATAAPAVVADAIVEQDDNNCAEADASPTKTNDDNNSGEAESSTAAGHQVVVNPAAAEDFPVCPYRLGLHNYTNLLKTYFRELAVPLLPAQFTACQPEPGQLRECVFQMSPVHFRVAQYLFRHLRRMSGHSGRTLMHAHNLALVWAPNLCHQPVITSAGGVNEAARISQHQANIVACLIEHCEALFVEPANVAPSARVVLDVIMPVQAGPSRGFDRANPLAASIRRNSSSTAGGGPSSGKSSSSSGGGKSSSGGRGGGSGGKGKSGSAKQRSKASSSKSSSKQRRSTSDDDRPPPRTPTSSTAKSTGSFDQLTTTDHAASPPTTHAATSATARRTSSAALDLASSPSAVAAASAMAAETEKAAAAAAEAEADAAPPKVLIKRAVRADSGASMRRHAADTGAAKVTIKGSYCPQAGSSDQRHRQQFLSRTDSQASNVSVRSARPQPPQPQPQKPQPLHPQRPLPELPEQHK